jgi:hypothetical protein
MKIFSKCIEFFWNCFSAEDELRAPLVVTSECHEEEEERAPPVVTSEWHIEEEARTQQRPPPILPDAPNFTPSVNGRNGWRWEELYEKGEMVRTRLCARGGCFRNNPWM